MMDDYGESPFSEWEKLEKYKEVLKNIKKDLYKWGWTAGEGDLVGPAHTHSGVGADFPPLIHKGNVVDVDADNLIFNHSIEEYKALFKGTSGYDNPDDITCRCKSCEQGKKVYEPEKKPRTGRLIERDESA